MKTRARNRVAAWSWLVVVGALLGGCAASNPSALRTLQQARTTLDLAKGAENPAARSHILEAEGALSYAEQEYRLSPNHPLSAARAENALAKARAAYQATQKPTVGATPVVFAAH